MRKRTLHEKNEVNTQERRVADRKKVNIGKYDYRKEGWDVTGGLASREKQKARVFPAKGKKLGQSHQ